MPVSELTDNDVLEMVKYRCQGCELADIARYFGIKTTRVRVITGRVKRDDLKEAAKSQEDLAAVERRYWTQIGHVNLPAEVLP